MDIKIGTFGEAGSEEKEKKATKLVRLKFGDELVKLNGITGVSKSSELDGKNDFVYLLTITTGGYTNTISYIDQKHRDIDHEHLVNLLVESGIDIL